MAQGQKGNCGAKTRRGTKCKGIPMKNGRCRMHGGKTPKKDGGSGRPPTTGEYETIYFDSLDKEEKEFVKVINTNTLEQIEMAVKLLTVRERRMMQRIANLRDNGVEYVTTGTLVTDLKGYKYQIDELTKEPLKHLPKEEYDKAKNVNTTKENKLEMIQRIEDALSRVQEKKTRLLDLKHKVETGTGNGNLNMLENFLSGMDTAVTNALENEEE